MKINPDLQIGDSNNKLSQIAKNKTKSLTFGGGMCFSSPYVKVINKTIRYIAD